LPRFKVVVTAYARQAFEQEVFVDARNKVEAEDKAVEVANAKGDWDFSGVPEFDGDLYVREPIKQVTRKQSHTRRRG
jgi:hypothetical protein